jgi:hypothetical protein
MAYHIEVDEALVVAYLCHPDRSLAEPDVDKFLNFLDGLAHTGDSYGGNPDLRLRPGSADCEVVFLFQAADGRLRVFRSIVSDAAAAYGVLRVRFAEDLG